MEDVKQFLRDLNEAFVKSDTDYILQHVTEDIRWNLIGDQIIEGKEKFEQVLSEMETDEAFELRIENMIIQPPTAVVNGSIRSKSPLTEDKTYFFCDLYKFGDNDELTVSQITSYVVEETKKAKSVKT